MKVDVDFSINVHIRSSAIDGRLPLDLFMFGILYRGRSKVPVYQMEAVVGGRRWEDETDKTST